MLTEIAPLSLLRESLISRAEFHPFPTASEREAWDTLPAELRQELIAAGEKYLRAQWPLTRADDFMDFWRTGNRSHYELAYDTRCEMLGTLVIAECVEGEGRFLDEIITGIWCLCEQMTWVLPAHNVVEGRDIGALLPDSELPHIDIFAGEIAVLLAWTHYLLAAQLDAISPQVNIELLREERKRLIEPYLSKTFPWQTPEYGTNNWNPWCNANCLLTVLLLDDNPDHRARAADICLRSLENFLHGYHPDGGCDEGASYWTRGGAALFESLDLLYQTSNGKIDLFKVPLMREIGKYIVRTYIHEDYFVNFADGTARLQIPANLIFRYGERTNDEEMKQLGLAGNLQSLELDKIWRLLPTIFNWSSAQKSNVTAPYLRDVWMPGVEQMAARENAGTPKGLFLAAKGGHNAESHNHNDVGQFIIFLDGFPLIVDPGVETYTKQTFSEQRYELWTTQSVYHNLPEINGVAQHDGREFKAKQAEYQTTDDSATFTIDISEAYPAAAGLNSWQRSCTLQRGSASAVTIDDKFSLQQAGEVKLFLMACEKPEMISPDKLQLTTKDGRQASMLFPAELAVSWEKIALTDAIMINIWGDHLYRIQLQNKKPIEGGDWQLTFSAEDCL